MVFASPITSRRGAALTWAAVVVCGCGGDPAGGGGGGGGGGESASGAAGAGANGSGAGGASAGGAGTGAFGGGSGGEAAIALPPANAPLDYQLGGAYPPPNGVEVVSRDRSASPAPGLYNICYVNGYQAQAEEADWWLTEHPDLILRDENGDPVIDLDWDEMLLDIGSPEKRALLATIVGGWISGCKQDGFDAVEIDNLDSYARSQGLLVEDDAVMFMEQLSSSAHLTGLAIAQKNSTELLPRRAEMGTDFAVAEECNRYAECGDYTDAYGDLVFVIEYRQQDFEQGCAEFAGLSIVLRDLNLVPQGSGAYVYDGC